MENDQLITIAQRKFDNIRNINSGGCGVSALALFKTIMKTKPLIKPQFVFLYNYKDLYLHNTMVLKNGRGRPKAPAHCCLLYDGEFIDSTGEVDISDWGWVQIVDKIKFLRECIRNKKEWNTMFKWDNIRTIERELKISLKEIY